MVEKYFGGTLPVERAEGEFDADLIAAASALRGKYEAEMEKFQFQNGLEAIFKVIQRANKYIDETAPWVLAKDEANRARLCQRDVQPPRDHPHLHHPAHAVHSRLLREDLRAIGAAADCRDWDSAAEWGRLSASVTVHKGEAIFPRIDMEKALAELEAIQEAQKKAALPALEIEPLTEEKVDFGTFCKSDFRAVKVKACEAVKKSDKLLRFTLDDGTGTDRQILRHPQVVRAGAARRQDAGRHRQPAAAQDDGSRELRYAASATHTEKGQEILNLIMVDDKIPAGAKLC